MNKVVHIIMLLLSGYCSTFGQEITEHTIYMEKLFEQLSEQNDADIDYTDWLATLDFYRNYPLNINEASASELKQLYILNDFQIAMILDYRTKSGPVLSIYELGYLPGFRDIDIQRLQAFTICEKVEYKQKGIREMLPYSKHQLLLRYQRVLEEQKGYSALPDSVLLANPNYNRYLGSPEKLYGRYSFNIPGNITGSIVMEKDAGEEFFKGNNDKGFDFYSASVEYKPKIAWLQEVVVGDYHLRAGQGLLLWSSYAFGKSSDLLGLSRNAKLISINRSVEENRFLRGTALTFSKKAFCFTGFVSYKNIDASIADTNHNYFTNFNSTGLHATPNENNRENTLGEQAFGGVAQYNTNQLHIGFNIISHSFEKSALQKNDLYETYDFTGNRYTGYSADYRYMAGRIHFFGESAYSNKNWATLNGLLLFPNSDITIGMLHRNYSKGYFAHWANAFSENSKLHNEEGVYIGGEMRLASHKFKIYTDVFAFPWLRYRANAATEGYELKGEWLFAADHTALYSHYKIEHKPQNYSEEYNHYTLAKILKESFTFRSDVTIGAMKLRNRIQCSKVAYQTDSSNYGVFISQEAGYTMQKAPLSIGGMAACFKANDYNNRFYVYERDVLYAAGTKMYYGFGWRFMCIVSWDITSELTLWLKAGQSRYPKSTTVGSGLNSITFNHRSEVKVQVRWKF